jgi:hypothetical protein
MLRCEGDYVFTLAAFNTGDHARDLTMEFFLVEAFSHSEFQDAVAALLCSGWRFHGTGVVASQLYDPKTDEWSFYYAVAMVRRKRLSELFVEWRDRWWSTGRQSNA